MNLLKALAQTSSLTLLSRIFGFLRDMVVAQIYGAGWQTDAFIVAFRIPNLLRRLFAEGAFSQAFVPILADLKHREGELAAHLWIDQVATTLSSILLVVSLLGISGAQGIITLTAPGFRHDPAQAQLASHLLQITFPYIFCISLVSLSAGVFNTWGRFWVPAFTPVLLNISVLVTVIWGRSWFHQPIDALAWGSLLGGLIQLLFQVPFLYRMRLLPRFHWAPSSPNIKKLLTLMGPALLGVSIGQISLLLSTLLASYLPHGSVSWLFYADRLMEFPNGLLGAALGTIILPSLVKHHSLGQAEQFSALLDWGLRLTLLLTLPASLILALAGIPILTTLFMRGAFHFEDVLMVQKALWAYCIGLSGFIAIKILAPGFYARQNIKTPVKIGLTVLAFNQLLNFILIGPLQHAGLALSTSLAACFNAIWLLHALRQNGHYQPQPGWGRFLIKIVLALASTTIVLLLVTDTETFWQQATILHKTLKLSVILLSAAATYLITLWLLGLRLKDFIHRIT